MTFLGWLSDLQRSGIKKGHFESSGMRSERIPDGFLLSCSVTLGEDFSREYPTMVVFDRFFIGNLFTFTGEQKTGFMIQFLRKFFKWVETETTN